MDIVNQILKGLEQHKAWMVKYPNSDDLFQISIISLYSTYKDKLVELNESKEINALFSKIVHNQVNFKYSEYSKICSSIPTVNIDYAKGIRGGVYPSIDIDKEINAIADNWYEKALIEEYRELGANSRELSRQTKIPRQTIDQQIKRLKQKIW